MAKHSKQSSKQNAVTGLSVAIICLSTCALLIGIIAIIYIGIGFGTIYFGNTALDIANNTQLGYQTSIEGNSLVIAGTSINILDLFSKGLSLIFGFTLFSFLTSVFSLVIGIITLKKATKKNMPDNIFLLNVLSAVFSFLGINVIRGVVIIVECVCMRKIKD